MRKGLLVLVLWLMPGALSGQWLQNPPQRVNEAQLLELINGLITDIHPDLPKNSYMTSLMKEKIRWAWAEHAANRLILTVYSGTNVSQQPLMESTWALDGRPAISIAGLRWWMLVRVQQRTPTGWTQQQKNTFAISFVHEVIHLEKKALGRKRTSEEWFNEELRTWLKTNVGAVRPLRALKQPLEPEFLEADDIFRACGDKLDCPGFQTWLKGRAGNTIP